MKKTVYTASIVILSCLFLFSCETVRYFYIETQRPADITFPAPSPKIVVVNNAAVQPANIGVEFKSGSKILSGYTVPKDSVHWAFINFFGKELGHTGSFDDVLVYNYSTRNDQNFLKLSEIPREKVDEIAEGAGADALISIDRVLFDFKQSLAGSDYFFCTAQIEYAINFSVYLPGKEKPMYSALLTDTLKYGDYTDYDTAWIYRELPALLLMESARNIAYEASLRFAPHWTQSERLIYTNTQSQMKRANAYAQKDKWNEAGIIWKELYETTKNNRQKARIAVNLAVSEEMNDRFSNALEWIQKALDSYALENPSNIKEELESARKYSQILEERKKQNVTLDRQLKVRR